ncbi:uncharacterized protein An03g03910 [Aspergillus niger]|uniref:Contig An03c0120, genomic contig n=2 Tax=Aspergillus niger TaxID=5061 RepID=A2QGN3_ASPNC|nr:uncharacterized protein An03g03910 [Aspergillus niger]CAK47830.1 unnamed protein product [Aspergillus niger]
MTSHRLHCCIGANCLVLERLTRLMFPGRLHGYEEHIDQGGGTGKDSRPTIKDLVHDWSR